MITPLIIFKEKLPKEIIDNIQLYLDNEIANKAVKLYLERIFCKEEKYNKFVYHNYIKRNCNCYQYLYPLLCHWCYSYIHTYKYTHNLWYICFINNDQLNKYASFNFKLLN